MAESKERNDGGKRITFIEDDSFEIATVFPPKLPNAGSFTTFYVVGKMEIERALCHLGASVSLMPHSMFYKFHLGPLQPVPFSLQLGDGSETQSLSALENVPVKIGDFWVVEDFIIAHMTETDDA